MHLIHTLTGNEMPNFEPTDAIIDKIITWVRIPGFPIEYYHSLFLNWMGNHLGRKVKVDEMTESALRGKFARICVELDLSKLLIPKFKMQRKSGELNMKVST